MTDISRTVAAPCFGVFEDRKADQPIFLVAGLNSTSCFRQAASFCKTWNGEFQTGKAVIRRATANVVFGRREDLR